MSQLDDFKSKFDEEGRFRNRDGTQSVVFAMKGGGRFPGKLQFSNGLCVRAEMEGGGDWGHPDNSPIHGIRFLLDFGDERLHEVAIDQGRVIQLDEAKSPLAKRDFLGNLRVASSTVSRPCTPELVSSELLAFSTVSGISEPRRHRNDDLKPLKAWKKRGSHASAEKTDRSKVSSSPKRLGFISAIAQMT